MDTKRTEMHVPWSVCPQCSLTQSIVDRIKSHLFIRITDSAAIAQKQVRVIIESNPTRQG